MQNFSKKRELTVEFIGCIGRKGPKLRSFIVRRYLIPSVEALAVFCHLPKCLQVLKIIGQSLKIDNLNFVRGLENLKLLSAQRSHVGNDDLKTLAECCPFIEDVDLSYSRSITDFSNLALLTNLKSLRLDGNRDYFTDHALIQIAMKCHQLRELALDSCARLTAESLQEIGRCHQLEYLSLWGLPQVTDTVLIAVTNGCRKLQYLDIKYCRKMTRIGLEGLLKLVDLRELFVSGITDFDQTFSEQLSRVTKLSKLEAVDCKYLKMPEMEPVRFPPEIPAVAVARLDC